MSSRIPSHQLNSGLVVSGRPEQQLKESQPTMASRAVPCTGGDVKKSGELGKMFDIQIADHPLSAPSSGPPPLSKLSDPRPHVPLLPQGLQHNDNDMDMVRNAIEVGKTKVLYFEGMSNPTLTVANIPELSRIGHEKGVTVVVDNTFSPMVLSGEAWC